MTTNKTSEYKVTVCRMVTSAEKREFTLKAATREEAHKMAAVYAADGCATTVEPCRTPAQIWNRINAIGKLEKSIRLQERTLKNLKTLGAGIDASDSIRLVETTLAKMKDQLAAIAAKI